METKKSLFKATLWDHWFMRWGLLSGSESDDSNWSIWWLEPHALYFQSDDEVDDSFAVLVPCYRHDCQEFEEREEEPSIQFLSAVKNLPNGYSAGGMEYMELCPIYRVFEAAN
ncbi:hypothetical protein Pfo_018796 [Paulownia fortunei]|nr:hypothetical protein Pfo_018796 [Paulownia fortunei]